MFFTIRLNLSFVKPFAVNFCRHIIKPIFINRIIKQELDFKYSITCMWVVSKSKGILLNKIIGIELAIVPYNILKHSHSFDNIRLST